MFGYDSLSSISIHKHMHTHTPHTARIPTHTDKSLGQRTLPVLSSPSRRLNLCEVYPADSLCSAQKCVETHSWRLHFLASAPPKTTYTHAVHFWCVCAVRQLFLCISVNTCIHLHGMFTLVLARLCLHFVSFTSCTAIKKSPSRCEYFSVLPWLQQRHS